MRRADRQLVPIRPAVASTRDQHCVATRPSQVKVSRATFAVDLEAISVSRPDVVAAIRQLLSVAVELGLMLPRPMFEQFVEHAIERLDEIDGDSDMEPEDDELDY
jgi:hypothetical protein